MDGGGAGREVRAGGGGALDVSAVGLRRAKHVKVAEEITKLTPNACCGGAWGRDLPRRGVGEMRGRGEGGAREVVASQYSLPLLCSLVVSSPCVL